MNKIFEFAMVLNTTLQGNLASKSLSTSQSIAKLANESQKLARISLQAEQRLQGLKNKIELNRNAYQQLQSLQRQGVGDQTRLANSIQQLESEYTRLTNSMRPYQAELQKVRYLEKQIESTQQKEHLRTSRNKAIGSWANVGAVATGVYAAASPLMGAISTAADFESSMSKVQAITGSSAEEMEKLRATASKLGATTMFSAKQSADAMTYLGMAGWKTEQIIAGMPGLLDLAAASGADLATVADIVSDDLTAFGMSANQAGRMADVMAAASSNANTNVEMMGATFKYAASVAGSLGYSLEDVALATGLMANAGIKGEQAGTSLRAVMTRLASPPKAAADAMNQLGISITNTDGTMKPLMQVMEECRGKFAGLNEEEKAQAASAIAGQEAMSGWLAIMNASQEDFDKLSNAINNSDGAAAKMAETMQNNAQGALTRLKSAMESIQIAIGSAVLPVLADFTDKLAVIAGAIGEFAQAHPVLMGLGVAIAGLAGTGLVAVAVFGALADSMLAIKAAWAVFEATSAGASLTGMLAPLSGIIAIGWPLVAVIAAIAGVAALLYANWDKVCEVAEIVSDKISSSWEIVRERLQPVFEKITGAFERLSGIFGGVASESSVLSSIINTFGAAIVSAVQIVMISLEGLINIFAVVFDSAVTWLGNVLDFIGNVFTGNWSAAWQNVVNIFGAICGSLWDLFVVLANQFFNTLSLFAPECAAAGSDFVAAADSWAQEAFTAIKEWMYKIPSMVYEKINAAKAALSSLFGLTSDNGDGAGDISSNANGGIYRKGAFLTTFAEEGPEAAIPLDGSNRAISLWQQAGQILGMIPNNIEPLPTTRALGMIPNNIEPLPTASALEMIPDNTAPSLAKRALEMVSDIGGTVNNTNNSSNQTISISIPVTVNGNADGPAISSMQSSIEEAVRRALADIRHQEGRVSFA